MSEILKLLALAVNAKASDIHISVGLPPIFRVNGKLSPTGIGKITHNDIKMYIEELLNQDECEVLEKNGEIDVSITPQNFDNIRMRLNCFRQRGTYSMALRILNQNIPSFEELGLPKTVAEKFCKLNHGLVIVTGPTGTGKTTTISSMINWINHNRSLHIITIEDPIEYYHKHDKSIVQQREIGYDTLSFATGLRSALRQDPDVLFIGEMRDLDSIKAAITAAETGHLVFSTLHTSGSAKTIDRIIDVFPSNQQQQVRAQLSLVLQGVLSQQLITNTENTKQVLAYEILLSNGAVRNLIRENHTTQIENVIATSKNEGMITMDASLVNLVMTNSLTESEAKAYSIYPEQFEALLKRSKNQYNI